MKNIMIVDDSPSMRMLISFTLEDAGFNVTQTSSAEEALEMAKDIQPSMVITDLNMESMNGIELVQELRLMSQYRFTPILMLTTESEDGKKLSGRNAGASAWITKPFSPMQLISTVNKFVR